MKKIILSIFICAFYFILSSQQAISTADESQLSANTKVITDSLNLKAEKYIFLNTDSSLHYAQAALFAAREYKLKEAESWAYYLLGGNYWIIGNYPNALDAEIKSLEISETLGNRKRIADTYRALASIYRDNGDFTNAIHYAKKCQAIAGKDIQVDILTILGSIYEKFNQPDSALYYLHLADKADVSVNGASHYGYISLVFGNVYFKKKEFTQAIKFYVAAIHLMESQKVYKDLIEGYNGIASVYRATAQEDSSIFYLQKSRAMAMQTPFLLGMLDAGRMLFSIYKSQPRLDSALKYSELSLLLEDTLYNQEKTRAFQALVFKEKLREQEIEELKTKAAEDRIQNIQIVSIAAFIPVFFIIAFLLSRKKINRGLIEFLVLVWLLLVFEFISLLIHPRLESLTHHRPIFMLLAMVLIASVLVPSHHRLLGFLKTRLTKRHNLPAEKSHR